MTLWLAPEDAANEAVATEYVVGTYRIDRCKLGHQLGAWVLSGPTEIRDLSRLVAGRVPCAFKVQAVYGQGFSQRGIAGSRAAADARAAVLLFRTWPDNMGFLVNDSTHEVLRVDAAATPNEVVVLERGVAGTEPAAYEVGHVMRPALVSDPVHGSYRWSPGPAPSTSRSAGTWNVTAHPIDLLLALLTSAAHPDDGLELRNYNPAFGNWSSLPVGFGVGYPASRIDFGSFLAVKAMYRSVELPAVILTDEDQQTLGEWVTTNILEPFGWFLTTTGGLLTLVAPHTLVRGEVGAVALGVDDIISYEQPEESYDLVAGAVTYQYRGANGEVHNTTIRSADFTGLFGGRAAYAGEDDAALVPVPGVVAGGTGTSALLTLLAQRRLLRAVRAPWRIPMRLDASHHQLGVGSVVRITHPDLPDLNTGTRGWVGVQGQVTAASRVTLGTDGVAALSVTVLVYPGFRTARIAPSAIITGVSGAGPWVCTVAPNRYTSPDGGDYLSLETADSDTFATADIVKTITRAGVDVVVSYDITATGPNTLTLDGMSAPTVGHVVVFADYVGAADRQIEGFVAWANDRGLITTDVPADRYGEP